MEKNILTTSTRESSGRISQAASTLRPENHLFNTHKRDLFSQVMPDNSQLLIPSTVNWIFQVPHTSLTEKSLKPDSRGCRRNPALPAVLGNSVPASYRDTIPQLPVSCRDCYQLDISGLPFQRLSFIKHPRTFIKAGKGLHQALDIAASLTPTAFHMLHFLTKMGSLISEMLNMQSRAIM